MGKHAVLLSVPGLREQDLAAMPGLSRLVARGDRAALVPSFPAVTCPVQANMTTGRLPRDHGVVANGFYWRDRRQVEMWTAWNDCIERPQIWDRLHDIDRSLTSAVWFAMHSKGCGADFVCTPAPVHNPDGSETPWCYTRPEPFYNELREELGDFPLKHFWGPLAGIQSTAWIVASAIHLAQRRQPNFSYIYLPHLDYAAQKFGPDSEQAYQSLRELDAEVTKLATGLQAAFGESPLWLVASEYTILPVDHVAYPNRVLRDADLLEVRDADDGELLDVAASRAWAMTDHQHAHVFVQRSDPTLVKQVAKLFKTQPGIAEVLTDEGKARHGLDHPRSGDVVLVSEPNSWQAYYWWNDDRRAPPFVRTVDIHRKPGYDPVELFFDPATRSIPLDATFVKGSHGAPAADRAQQGVMLSSEVGTLGASRLRDADVAELVLAQFAAGVN
jgi:predicted AlkP superfamily pyrophosphatase or phosphodiesterase